MRFCGLCGLVVFLEDCVRGVQGGVDASVCWAK